MSAPPASNGVFVVIPPSNTSGLRPPPAILPPSMCQPPGAVQLEEPPLGTQTPRAAQSSDLRPMDTFLTGEPKALGTVQILIGLIHLGFGSVLLMVRRGPLGMLFIQGGVPFWGGSCVGGSHIQSSPKPEPAKPEPCPELLAGKGCPGRPQWGCPGLHVHLRLQFVLSGCLSVAAERSHTGCLVRSSLGTNILSATAAFAGTAILLMDFGVTSWSVVFLPNTFGADFAIPSPATSPPPAYDNVAYIPKEASE
ncbi:Membrane-spanning 4-domains subfamily A member 15 [Heterocephalus glaber]|uniref:Membrane-spanning 4-domains subfamily A member 15 n=1 Tax=Heterocephalus glaber TaxID=10181 RepID=G5AYE0_HETGA|nr:Membrane-spanning 4-domains subfamily A member 15 [Heterocephalus glaber]